MGIRIIHVAVEGYDNNVSYIIGDEKTKEAAIVDPCGDVDRVFETAEDEGYDVRAILLTHTHHDHIDKLEEAEDRYPDAKVYVHEVAEGKLGTEEEQQELIQDGSVIQIGNSEVEVWYTPGHNEDSVCYLVSADQADDGIPKILTGDTVFVEGCGRTSNMEVEDLYESIQRIKTLPDETEVYPAHDYGSQESSTIGYEKEENKYFLAEDFQSFKHLRLG